MMTDLNTSFYSVGEEEEVRPTTRARDDSPAVKYKPGPASSKAGSRRGSVANSINDDAETAADGSSERRSARLSAAESRAGARSETPVGAQRRGSSGDRSRSPRRRGVDLGEPLSTSQERRQRRDREQGLSIDPGRRADDGKDEAMVVISSEEKEVIQPGIPPGLLEGGELTVVPVGTSTPIRSGSPAPHSALSTPRRGPGRPPTSGEYIGRAKAKREEAEATLMLMDARLAENVSNMFADATRAFARTGADSMEEVPTPELEQAMLTAANMVDEVAKKSRNIKGNLVRQLKNAAQLVRLSADQLVARVGSGGSSLDVSEASNASTSEVKRLQAKLQTCQLEVRILKAELAELRSAKAIEELPAEPSTVMGPPLEKRVPGVRTKLSDATGVGVEAKESPLTKLLPPPPKPKRPSPVLHPSSDGDTEGREDSDRRSPPLTRRKKARTGPLPTIRKECSLLEEIGILIEMAAFKEELLRESALKAPTRDMVEPAPSRSAGRPMSAPNTGGAKGSLLPKYSEVVKGRTGVSTTSGQSPATKPTLGGGTGRRDRSGPIGEARKGGQRKANPRPPVPSRSTQEEGRKATGSESIGRPRDGDQKAEIPSPPAPSRPQEGAKRKKKRSNKKKESGGGGGDVGTYNDIPPPPRDSRSPADYDEAGPSYTMGWEVAGSRGKPRPNKKGTSPELPGHTKNPPPKGEKRKKEEEPRKPNPPLVQRSPP